MVESWLDITDYTDYEPDYTDENYLIRVIVF